MVTGSGPTLSSGRQNAGVDRTVLRLAVFAVLVVAAFVALFSRMWFLQVLAAGDYRSLAKENRMRFVYSEPPRGRILDRNGKILVGNRYSRAVTIDRRVVEPGSRRERRVLRSLAGLLVPQRKQGADRRKALKQKVTEMRGRLNDGTVSPYKPVPVVNDVSEAFVTLIREQQEDFRGVEVEDLPVRTYPNGPVAAQLLGYVGEINEEELESELFRGAKPPYEAGDLVGKAGIERTYDRHLRGKPEIKRVIVNSAGDVVGTPTVKQKQQPGRDLILSVDLRIQKIAEKALEAGILAARQAYQAPDGAVVVMDPNTGGIVALASYPSYDPAMLADGITPKEYRSLGGSPSTGDDDKLLNRAIQAAVPPGSTFKAATAGAAMATGIADAGSYLGCPPYRQYGYTIFRNWTSVDFGSMGFPKSLEVSCDTFYYELGWQMEDAFGASLGDGSEKFQDYLHTAGFGQPTGVDLPFEAAGRVPDKEWCDQYRKEGLGCFDGWLPGMSVNLAIGQGDLTVSPMQMATTYAALAGDGRVWRPRVGWKLGRPDRETGKEQTVHEFEPKAANRLPLDTTEIGVIRQGLEDVVMGAEGTATSAFAGFPLDRYPVAGKTGTAQIGSLDSGLNYAWFASYAPADDPRYVIAVYLAKAGHGGESAAPIARQIFEGIFDIDEVTDVRLGQDFSG